MIVDKYLSHLFSDLTPPDGEHLVCVIDQFCHGWSSLGSSVKMILQNDSQLVPQPLLSHPGCPDELILKQFVDILTMKINWSKMYYESHLLNWWSEVPGLHLHHRDSGATIVVRQDQWSSSAAAVSAVDDGVSPDACDAGHHAAAQYQRISPRHAWADPCQLSSERNIFENKDTKYFLSPEWCQQSDNFILFSLHSLQSSNYVALFALTLLWIASLHILHYITLFITRLMTLLYKYLNRVNRQHNPIKLLFNFFKIFFVHFNAVADLKMSQMKRSFN